MVRKLNLVFVSAILYGHTSCSFLQSSSSFSCSRATASSLVIRILANSIGGSGFWVCRSVRGMIEKVSTSSLVSAFSRIILRSMDEW
uniref:Putative secreted protein n=1 Tax=Anopheles darlingi TaxID=43151 RepID=A0A2M4DCF9_ANODA